MFPTRARNNAATKINAAANIPDPPQLLSRLLWHLVRQEIQHHGRPAGISAPSASENQRPEYLCYGIMDGCRLKYTCEEIVPESLDLHVFVTNQAEIDQHVQTDKQLNDAPGMPVFFDEQEDAQRNGHADIAEIEQIEQIALCQPQRNGYCFKYSQHHDRHRIFLHLCIPTNPGWLLFHSFFRIAYCTVFS